MRTSLPPLTWLLLSLPIIGPVPAAGAAEWSGLHRSGGAVAELASPALAFLSPSSALLAGVRVLEGRQRVVASRFDGVDWVPVEGGAPVDGAEDGEASNPRIAPDGTGGAVLCVTRFDGTRWRLFARRYDGTGWADLNGGAPVDHPGAGGSVLESAVTATTRGTILTLFTQFDGTRAALFGGVMVDGEWSWLAEGEGIAPGAGPVGSSLPALAADDAGGAVAAFVREVATGPRLFALRWDGSGWQRLDAGLPLDRPDLGGVRGAAVAALPGGRILVAYLQEDLTGTPRLYGLIRSGAAWIRINDGAPLDAESAGVAMVSAAAAGTGGGMVVYGGAGAAPHLRSLRISGATAVAVDGGSPLEAPGAGAVARPALAAATAADGGAIVLLAIPQDDDTGSRVFARDLAIPSPSAVEPVQTAGAWSVGIEGAVFLPGRGGQARITVRTRSPQRLRVGVHGLAGGGGRLLHDAFHPSGLDLSWDGRDETGRFVPPGTYLLVVTGDTFREIRRVVVIR